MSPNQKNIMLLNIQNLIWSVRISHLRLFVLATHSVRSAQVVFSFSPEVAFPLARGTPVAKTHRRRGEKDP